MKVFVASSSDDLEKVKILMDLIENNQNKITYDWTEAIKRENMARMTKGQIDESMLANFKAIDEADIIVFYTYQDRKVSIGALIEIGYALGIKKKIIIYNELSIYFPLLFHQLNHSYLNIDIGGTILRASNTGDLIKLIGEGEGEDE